MLKYTGIVLVLQVLLNYWGQVNASEVKTSSHSELSQQQLALLEDNLEKDPIATEKELETIKSKLPSEISRRSLWVETLLCETKLAQGMFVPAYEESRVLIQKYESFNNQARFGYLLLCHALASENTGHYKKSTQLYDRAIDLAILTEDKKLQSKALRSRGDFYALHGTVEQALMDLQASYRISESIDDQKGVFRTKNSLAILYSYTNEDQKALEYYEEVYQYAKDQGLVRPVSILTYNLGKAHQRLQNLDEADRYFDESIGLSRALNDSAGVAFALRGQAEVYLANKQLELARQRLEEVVALFTSLGNQMQVAQTTTLLADIYFKLNQYDRSIRLYQESIKVFHKKESIYSLSLAYKQLSQVYEKVEDYKNAYESYVSHNQFDNKYRQLKHEKRLEELRVVFDTERAEVANKLLVETNKLTAAELEQQIQFSNFQTAIIGLGLIVVTLLVFQVRRNLQNKKRLELLVRTDELTQLANRRYIMELIEREFKLALRGNSSLALIMFDIDHFKSFNDKYGHKVGDEVLQAVSRCCQEQVRSTDLLGRIGGEEFLIFLPQTQIGEAMEVAERCRLAVESLDLSMVEDEVRLTISLGVTSFDDNLVTVDDMLNEADIAMYQAKSQGRNKVCAS